MNATAYVGCAAASYGFGVISDKIGWNGTIIVWLVLDAVGMLITLLATGKWKRFIKGEIK
jgi:OPA family glycerol-3-phosphate transporter-like MFS transporter